MRSTKAMQSQRIEIRNAQKLVEVNRSALEALAKSALSRLGRRRARLDVLITDDSRIREIKRRYMGIDAATDVISFDTGDIVISAETARRNGSRFGTSPFGEICLYLIHGILHLSGYDDAAPSSRRRMEKKQEELMIQLCKGTA